MRIDTRQLFVSLLFALLLPFTAFAGETVDINTADAATMASVLDGVGEKKAEAIVEYRDKNGLFESVDDFTKVKGIGPKILEKNRDKIVVSASSSDSSEPEDKGDKASGEDDKAGKGSDTKETDSKSGDEKKDDAKEAEKESSDKDEKDDKSDQDKKSD